MDTARQEGILRLLYGNAVIRSLALDATGEELRLKVVHDDREYWNILYKEMYYTQLEENAVGLAIAVAKEEPASALSAPRYGEMTGRFMADCCVSSLSFLKTLEGRGHRMMVHYGADDKNYLVVAKSIQIEPL